MKGGGRRWSRRCVIWMWDEGWTKAMEQRCMDLEEG